MKPVPLWSKPLPFPQVVVGSIVVACDDPSWRGAMALQVEPRLKRFPNRNRLRDVPYAVNRLAWVRETSYWDLMQDRQEHLTRLVWDATDRHQYYAARWLLRAAAERQGK